MAACGEVRRAAACSYDGISVRGALSISPPVGPAATALGGRHEGSRHGEVRVRPHLGTVKPQHNVLPRNSGFQQIFRDASFGAIMLDPDLVAFEIDMDDSAVHPLLPVPSNVHELIVARSIVEHRLDLDLAVGRLELRIVLDHPPDDGSILSGSIHLSITSSSGT